jgi:Transglutaminase-like superfamily
VIAEIIPEAYDAVGMQVSQPFHGRKGLHPTFPMGRYVSQPLAKQCKTIADVRSFLLTCGYVSDQELFDKRDYWQPPDEFETRKKGDCEDFALWTWRQLLNMGYDARFVGGSAGRYGSGHAWIEYFKGGKCFLLEPLACRIGYTLPRLSTLRYEPRFSISWDGKNLRYFSHRKPDSHLGLRILASLIPEYLLFWTSYWMMNAFRLPLIIWNVLLKEAFKRENWRFRKRRTH